MPVKNMYYSIEIERVLWGIFRDEVVFLVSEYFMMQLQVRAFTVVNVQ